MIDLTVLLLLILAVWRLTHLLHAEDGPWDVVARVRAAAGTGFWGRLLGCFYCLSLWVALPWAVLVGQSWTERALLWLGTSGGAILAERATAPPDLPTAWYLEDPPPNEQPSSSEDTDALLRTDPPSLHQTH